MTSSKADPRPALAKDVKVTDAELVVTLVDGRSVSVPIDWYPRLRHGSAEERSLWRLIGGGSGIHWDELDEDIAVDDLLAGRRSGESQTSMRRWLGSRASAG